MNMTTAVVALASIQIIAGEKLISLTRAEAVATLEQQGYATAARPKLPEHPSAENFDAILKWAFTDSFTVRLVPPSSLSEIEHVDVSYCPADNVVSGVAVSYRASDADLAQYAGLTSEVTSYLGYPPTKVWNEGKTLSTRWKLKNGEGATAWYQDGVGIGLTFAGSTASIDCHSAYVGRESQDSTKR